MISTRPATEPFFTPIHKGAIGGVVARGERQQPFAQGAAGLAHVDNAPGVLARAPDAVAAREGGRDLPHGRALEWRPSGPS